MKNVFMIFLLIAAFSFTASGQDYVDMKTAVQRMDVEITEMQGDPQQPSLQGITGAPLRLGYFLQVRKDVMAEEGVLNIGAILTSAYNKLTNNGTSKLSTTVAGHRTELDALLRN